MNSVNGICADISQPTLLKVPSFSDARGQLGVIEGDGFPFEIKRIYYQFDVPMGAVRGEHGHKNLQQFMICMHGACEVRLNDGLNQTSFELDTPTVGLFVTLGHWRSIHFNKPDSVLCVLASRPYEHEDYIYTFEEFLVWTKNRHET